jgi:hypothetical protein
VFRVYGLRFRVKSAAKPTAPRLHFGVTPPSDDSQYNQPDTVYLTRPGVALQVVYLKGKL